MLNNPVVFGQPYTFDIVLVDQSNTKVFKSNPTLAAGDFAISKDGGALTNLATLPTVTPSGGQQVRVSLSAAEMSCQNATVHWADASGAEWCSGMYNVQPGAGNGAIEYGTAQAATSSTLTLRSAAAYADNELTGCILCILSASAGAAQSRFIASNVGSTDVVTVDPAFTTTPSGTVLYAIFASPPAPAAAVPNVNVLSMSTDAVSAAALSTASVTKVVTAIFARTFHATKMGGLTFSQVCAVIYSVLANKITGMSAGTTSTVVIRNANDSATVVSAPCDADGNRTSTPTVTTSAIE